MLVEFVATTNKEKSKKERKENRFDEKL